MKKPDCWTLVHDALNVEGEHVLLYGPPGTGKTYEATDVGPDGIVLNVTCSEDTPAAELRGHFVNHGDDGWKWMHGPAVQAWHDSHKPEIKLVRLVLNEVDRLSGDGLTFLYGIMDDPHSPHTQITLPTGLTVTPTTKFQVVCTMNGEPEDLPEALVDRVTPINVDKVNPKSFLVLPEWMRAMAEETGNLTDDRRLSVRRWIKYARFLKNGVNEQHAAWLAFGEQAESVLDTLAVAKAAKRKINHPYPITNSNLMMHFSAWDDIDPNSLHYCGWHRAMENAYKSAANCKPMAFLDEDEFNDFAAEFGTADPETAEGMAALRRASIIGRCRSKVIDPDLWEPSTADPAVLPSNPF